MPSEVDLLDKKSHDQDDRGRLMKPRRSSLENEDLESRLIELNAELRRENEKLVRELEELGSQNVEMAFQIGELHEELDRRLQQATRDFESEREQLNNQLLAREDENLTLGGLQRRREIEDRGGAGGGEPQNRNEGAGSCVRKPGPGDPATNGGCARRRPGRGASRNTLRDRGPE